MKRIFALICFLAFLFTPVARTDMQFAPAWDGWVSVDPILFPGNVKVFFPKLKLSFGPDGSYTDVSLANPFPVVLPTPLPVTIPTPLPVSQSGTWTVQQGTPPWSVSQSGSWTTGRTWNLLNTTDSVNSVQSGTWTTGRTWTLANSTDSVTAFQGTSPWVSNTAQFGGNNVVTGTGPSGVGIPRVTISNDSNVLATQSGAWTTGRTWSLLNTTDSVNSVQSGTWTTGRTWNLLNTTDSVNSVQSGTWTTGRTWTLSNSTDSVTVFQGTSPWADNVSQFGGINVSTGTGASGPGIPRVTVANDSKVQLWDGTNTVAVKPASTAAGASDPSAVIAFSPNTPLPSGTNAVGRLTGDSYFHPTFSLRAQAVVNSNSVSSTSLATTINSTSSGNTIIVAVNCDNTTTPTVTDSASQTYTQATSISTGSAISYIFYKANTASGVTSVTVNNANSTAINVVVTEYSGLATTTSLDQTSTHGNTNVTSWTSNATATTAQTNELLFGTAMNTAHNNTTFTAGTGWTAIGSVENPTGGVNMGIFAEEQYVGATGAYAAIGTLSQSDTVQGSIATFKVAGNAYPSGFVVLNQATVIKASAGTFRKIIINNPGSSGATASFYDNASSASGTSIAKVALSPASATTLFYDLLFSNGLTMVLNSNTADFTVTNN